MKTYLITYDLKMSWRNYNGLYDAIKSYGIWGMVNDSTWIIKTYDSAIQIRDFLINYIDYNDSLFVIKTDREAAWRNVKADSDWLKNNL